ncbi:Uncharacterised protein [Mycobacteroides abscessus subsp. abscessus]|nr:Uncharacterised protein [Mycobacteroides abscessus subsp. abscessus]
MGAIRTDRTAPALLCGAPRRPVSADRGPDRTGIRPGRAGRCRRLSARTQGRFGGPPAIATVTTGVGGDRCAAVRHGDLDPSPGEPRRHHPGGAGRPGCSRGLLPHRVRRPVQRRDSRHTDHLRRVAAGACLVRRTAPKPASGRDRAQLQRACGQLALGGRPGWAVPVDRLPPPHRPVAADRGARSRRHPAPAQIDLARRRRCLDSCWAAGPFGHRAHLVALRRYQYRRPHAGHSARLIDRTRSGLGHTDDRA